jgi:hypothetical protein
MLTAIRSVNGAIKRLKKEISAKFGQEYTSRWVDAHVKILIPFLTEAKELIAILEIRKEEIPCIFEPWVMDLMLKQIQQTHSASLSKRGGDKVEKRKTQKV